MTTLTTVVKHVDLQEKGKRTWIKLIYDPATNSKTDEFVRARKLKGINDCSVRRFYLCPGIYVVGMQDGHPARFVKITHDGSAQYLTYREANFGADDAWRF